MSAKVITSENKKGGVGKTTTAVHLAVRLAQYAQRKEMGPVLLVCVDPQGDTRQALGIRAEHIQKTLSDLLLTPANEAPDYDSAIISADLSQYDEALPARPNLYYLPASDRLTQTVSQLNHMKSVFGAMASDEMMSEAMAQKLGGAPMDAEESFLSVMEPLRDQAGFSYIVVDCPPTIGPLQLAIHKFADLAVVPTMMGDQCVGMTYEHTRQIIKDQQAGAKIRLLAVQPTAVQPQLKMHQKSLEQLHNTYGKRRLLMRPIR